MLHGAHAGRRPQWPSGKAFVLSVGDARIDPAVLGRVIPGTSPSAFPAKAVSLEFTFFSFFCVPCLKLYLWSLPSSASSAFPIPAKAVSLEFTFFCFFYVPC